MINKQLLLATTVALGLGFAATAVQAGTLVTTDSTTSVNAPAVQVNTSVATGTKQTEVTRISTHRVGKVGYQPYPVVTSHVEKHEVTVGEPQTSVVAYTDGPVAETTTVRTSTHNTGEKSYTYSHGGGVYYTENGSNIAYDPALNIAVVNTGSFND